MDAQDIAAQLRCPNGEEAPEVARRMNEANQPLNLMCIDLLRLQPADKVLEIGPGNGAFVANIVRAVDGVSYTGLDWSADMVAEAESRNADLVASGRARFQQGSSDRIPFATASFDKALSVHTLYFWERPQEHLAEVRRVLKPGGTFCIAFGDRSFMKDLPFAPFGFTLYDAAEAQELLTTSGFRALAIRQHHETGPSNTGEIVEKTFHILLCDRKTE